MKTPVAVALIVMGGLLVMTPVVSDYLYQRNLVALLSHPGVQSVNLDGKMGDLYRIGCYAIGGVMVSLAIIFSLPAHYPAAARENSTVQAA